MANPHPVKGRALRLKGFSPGKPEPSGPVIARHPDGRRGRFVRNLVQVVDADGQPGETVPADGWRVDWGLL